MATGFLVLAALYAAQTLWVAGAFRRIEPHFDGTCRLVKGAWGPEDITIDPETEIAWISASPRRSVAAGRPKPGALLVYDLRRPDTHPEVRFGGRDASFQPHGLSLWRGDDGRRRLFVINHPPPGTRSYAHSVEVFDVVGRDQLRHRQTLTDELLVMPNDLVAIGPDRFYLTNTHANPPGFRQSIETYLQLPGGNVLLFRDGRFQVAVGGLVFPNGINLSPDGRKVYVASVTRRSILAFARDPRSDQLAPAGGVFIGSGGDNIEVDEQGALWVAAHPMLLRVQALANDPSAAAPAQVFRIDPPANGNDQYVVTEVYLNDGREFGGASVAAHFQGRLLIGRIFDNGFLDCRLRRGQAQEAGRE